MNKIKNPHKISPRLWSPHSLNNFAPISCQHFWSRCFDSCLKGFYCSSFLSHQVIRHRWRQGDGVMNCSVIRFSWLLLTEKCLWTVKRESERGVGNEFSQMLSSNTDTQVEKMNNLLGLKNHKWFCCQARESSFWDESIFFFFSVLCN